MSRKPLASKQTRDELDDIEIVGFSGRATGNRRKPMSKSSRSEPLIRLYFARMKPAFLELSDEEKAEFTRRDRENLDALGMQAVTMIDCRWSNDEWDYIGVEQWPDIRAIYERERFEKDELHVSRYVESKTLLGTPRSFADYGKS